MPELFDSVSTENEPLASRMRPRTLDEYIGQDHIVGKGRLLRRAIALDQLTSVIFYGPPGTGKTTLARVIANHTSSNFITLNAVLTGVADIRKAISEADDNKKLYGRKTILFVDEVHRWNKSQQDALLPWVENGTIILIGATTENPFFEVNKALVSRSRVFQLKQLSKEDLQKAAMQAINDTERGYGHWKVTFEKGALEHLVETANGDCRSLLNALQLAIETTPERWAPNETPPVPSWGSTIYISMETAEESIQKKVVLYDRDGDYHYDIISAFIKSLRGRDPDAACYWLARMIKAGEDPSFIFRRMLISACEDTGLADPNAITVVQSCADAFDRVGLPEGRYFLAHAALYLSTAPKSNSSMAFFDALAAVEKEDAEVPNHLKDASRDAEGFGHGAGYMYPHAYRDHWVSQQYLPDTLVGRVFYTPTTQGYEAKIRDEVLSRREIQIAGILEEPVNAMQEWWVSEHFKAPSQTEENLTFTPVSRQNEKVFSNAEKSWRARLDSNKAEILLTIRDSMTNLAEIKRHHRSLIWHADDGLLIFDITRKTPEGCTCGICRNENSINVLKQYASTLEDLDKPLLSVLSVGSIRNSCREFSDVIFDRIFFRDIFTSSTDIDSFIKEIKDGWSSNSPLFDPNARIILSQKIPCHGQRISRLIRTEIFSSSIPDNETEKLLKIMEEKEAEFYADKTNTLFNWDESTIKNSITDKGFECAYKIMNLTEKRRVCETEIQKWFDSKNSRYGKIMEDALGKDGVSKITDLLCTHCKKHIISWKLSTALFCITQANSTL